MTNQPVSFNTIAQDSIFHGREEKGDWVIKDSVALARLYSEMYPPCPRPDEKPKPPEVDFDIRMVIAVFQGACPSGSYGIEIKSLTNTGEGLEVLIEEDAPSGEDVVTMNETYPAHLVETERYDGKVTFKRE